MDEALHLPEVVIHDMTSHRLGRESSGLECSSKLVDISSATHCVHNLLHSSLGILARVDGMLALRLFSDHHALVQVLQSVMKALLDDGLLTLRLVGGFTSNTSTNLVYGILALIKTMKVVCKQLALHAHLLSLFASELD